MWWITWRYKGYRGKRCDDRQAFRILVKTVLPEQIDWCEEKCTGAFSVDFQTFWFEKRNDALMFKLIWGGV